MLGRGLHHISASLPQRRQQTGHARGSSAALPSSAAGKGLEDESIRNNRNRDRVDLDQYNIIHMTRFPITRSLFDDR